MCFCELWIDKKKSIKPKFKSKHIQVKQAVLTKSHMYGTEMSAKPAEKLVIPIALVRSVGGYWNDVNAGIMALATPVVLLPKKESTNSNHFHFFARFNVLPYQAWLETPPMSNHRWGKSQCILNWDPILKYYRKYSFECRFWSPLKWIWWWQVPQKCPHKPNKNGKQHKCKVNISTRFHGTTTHLTGFAFVWNYLQALWHSIRTVW